MRRLPFVVRRPRHFFPWLKLLVNTPSSTMPPSSRDLALTVQELEPGEFYWVLMEAVDEPPTHRGATHSYLPLEAAGEPQASYSNALAAGVSVLRRLSCGVAPGRTGIGPRVACHEAVAEAPVERVHPIDNARP